MGENVCGMEEVYRGSFLNVKVKTEKGLLNRLVSSADEGNADTGTAHR